MTASEVDYKVIDRQIGLVGGAVLLMGTVIGISVFLLPGALIGVAGPSITIALALTTIPMVFSVLMMLQLGGALPVAGGVYVYASRLVGPFWGFLIIWLIMPAIWSALLFTSIGFAEFTRFFVDVPAELLMAGVLLAFLALNLLGITIVAWIQFAMVSAIILGILAFVLPGAGQINLANFTPMFPQGVAPFFLAVVALYIPFQGYGMIVELGEELEDPVKNIPRVLMIGMALAVLLSLALVVVFVGLDSSAALAQLGAGGIAVAANVYLPGWVGAAVAAAAILGAFTTLNALITSYSRTLMRAARDDVLPKKLAEIHPKTQVPHWAVLTLGVPPILFVPFSPSPVVLSVFLALTILFGGFISAIALWNLPKRFSERYERSLYKLPMPVLKVAAIGSAVAAVLFWLAMVRTAPVVVLAIVALCVAGSVSYRYRVWTYNRVGESFGDRLASLHAHE